MYGMNENQNVFMDGKRTTSRVTNEPGGKSSVQLGWDSPKRNNLSSPAAKEPKSKQKTQKEKENVMQIVGSASATTKPTTTNYSDKSSRGVSSNAYAIGSRQNTGNVITDRPTSRVTQPPGGKSSISFC